MKVVKNTDTHVIEMPYNFYTYILPVGQAVSVPDDFYDFLQDRLPLSFNFGKQLEKERPAEVEKYRTKSFYPTQQSAPDLGTEDMRIQPVSPTPTFGTPDGLPADGQADKDGVAFYGEGIQEEKL